MTTIENWLIAEPIQLLMTFVSAAVVYTSILAFTRIAGLRSFSKMSAADFAMTIAVGSLFAATISAPNPSLAIGLMSIGSLFLGQWVFAVLRRRYEWFGNLFDNQPLLLMIRGQFLDENLRRANVTRADLFAKLRESNTLNYDEVLAVIFETTGDISVLHSSDNEAMLEPDFIRDVAGAKDHLD